MNFPFHFYFFFICYENLHMQYTDFFPTVKLKIILDKILTVLIFLLKTLIVGTR